MIDDKLPNLCLNKQIALCTLTLQLLIQPLIQLLLHLMTRNALHVPSQVTTTAVKQISVLLEVNALAGKCTICLTRVLQIRPVTLDCKV